MARLDFFLTSNDIYTLSEKCSIEPGYRTDHSIITLKLNLNKERRGKGFWKMNTSLLHDIEYVNKVKECIKENITRYAKEGSNINVPDVELTISNRLFLDCLKLDIRGTTIAYASR